MNPLATAIINLLLWGAVATAVLSGVQFGAQSLGFSRLSLPFLIGTCFTGERRPAMAIGIALYAFGGWLFAFLYFLLFASMNEAGWLRGLLIGGLHGFILLAVLMPVLPYLHPRMATAHDSPLSAPRLHPPGFMALHYGYATPLVTIVAHMCYGLILGAMLIVKSS